MSKFVPPTGKLASIQFTRFMTNSFNQAKQLIENSEHILLTTHERTDGDDFGTVSALAQIAQNMGKFVTITIKGGVPKALRFLQGSHEVTEELKENNYDLLIISGCSNKNRIGIPNLIDLAIPTINIDHHVDNSYYGQVNIVEPNASSVAELALKFINWSNWQITNHIATALLTGIVADTGCFMHSNTEPATLRAAASLLKKGATTYNIIKHTFKGKEPQVLKAWGLALENSQINKQQHYIFSALTDEDFKKIGDIPHAAFEGFVETINKAKEAQFALFLKQDNGEIKGSLRSESHKGANVGAMARLFGGGGHKLASGFSIPGKLIKDSETWKIINSN